MLYHLQTIEGIHNLESKFTDYKSKNWMIIILFGIKLKHFVLISYLHQIKFDTLLMNFTNEFQY